MIPFYERRFSLRTFCFPGVDNLTRYLSLWSLVVCFRCHLAVNYYVIYIDPPLDP
jgi:hypothetical protein